MHLAPPALSRAGRPAPRTASARRIIRVPASGSRLSHGIVNEIYFPHVDSPNTRDLQFLITDGETSCHEEKRDLDHRTEYPRAKRRCSIDSPTPTATAAIASSRKLSQSHIRRFCSCTPGWKFRTQRLRGKLRLYALLAPHITAGLSQSRQVVRTERSEVLEARRENICTGLRLPARFHATLRRLRRPQ